ncbi:hypothetical protein BFP70_05135 [Thioclava sp. SK-1]|uniref:glycosyltransferase n=1 Tax=Thioclava sp. SK-1 TaxID=1889770 RepID=UPI0008270463|nr:glycosyltransferase [Thioclava sp. SK-1]OCX66409.1 hypothetical protein BFP70_05135 [Thioclava sp. SK-1]
MTAQRFLFLCPDISGPAGGAAVIYDMVTTLRDAGRDAAVVHGHAGGHYPDYPTQVPRFWDDRLLRGRHHHTRRARGHAKLYLAQARNQLRKGDNPKLDLRRTDVIIVPELWLSDALSAYPDQTLCGLVQNPFYLLDAHATAQARGQDLSRQIHTFLSTSDICHDHLDLIGAPTPLKFRVSMHPDKIPFVDTKDALITYMPRKRPDMARLIHQALERRGQLQGFKLQALDHMPRTQVIEHLGRSQFFISLMHHESLGFPAAEAMAAGCVVIGFDGLGGAEYFDHDVGFPIPEGNAFGIVAQVEQAIAALRLDPHCFDTLRQRAAHRIQDRYPTSGFQAGVLDCWATLERNLSNNRV